MAVTPWKTAGAVSGVDWAPDSGTLKECLEASDDVRATHDPPVDDYLILGDFGFSVSPTAVIEGYEVLCESRCNTLLLPDSPVPELGFHLSLDGVTPVGQERTLGCSQFADGTGTVGGPTDTFGVALDPADVNDPGFSVMIRKADDSDEAPDGDRQIDFVEMRVHFSEGGVNPIIATRRRNHRRVPDFGVRDKTKTVEAN